MQEKEEGDIHEIRAFLSQTPTRRLTKRPERRGSIARQRLQQKPGNKRREAPQDQNNPENHNDHSHRHQAPTLEVDGQAPLEEWTLQP